MKAFVITAMIAFCVGFLLLLAAHADPELNPSRYQAEVLRADGMAHDGQPVLSTTDFGAKGFVDLDEGKDNVEQVQRP